MYPGKVKEFFSSEFVDTLNIFLHFFRNPVSITSFSSTICWLILQVEESEKLFADLTPAKSVDYKLKYLNPDVEVDQAFLNQVKYLKAIPNTVSL